MKLSQWAEAYAYISEGHADPGRWRSYPFQPEIMDACTDVDVEYVVWMKSARVGYTKTLNHAIGYYMHQEPAPILMVQPTIDDAKGYSKDEIEPMLRDTPVLAEIVPHETRRDGKNTITKKVYPGGGLDIVGANSPRAFRRITKKIILLDEVDGYPLEVGAEGDQIKLAIKRSETFPDRKIIMGSTPTEKATSRIERYFETTDQRYYYVPCPECGEKQPLEWAHFKWPEGEPENAYFECQHCGEAMLHKYKRWMIENGEWIATEPFKGRAGFRIWAAYSYSANATWPKIAMEFLDSKGDTETLKTFINTVLGETWEDPSEQIDDNELFNRREIYDDTIPDQVLVLVAGVDVQDNRLEGEVKGFGPGEESFGIEYFRIMGDPSKPDIWKSLHAKLETIYTNNEGHRYPIALACIDSGGHHTDMVYKFCRKNPRRFIPTKGHWQTGKPVADMPIKPNKNKVYLTMIGTDVAKSILYHRFKLADPGAGFCHWPASDDYDSEYFAQATAERKKTKIRKGVKVIEWELKKGRRNEALDINVLCLAAIRILQTRFNFKLEKYSKKFTKKSPPATDIDKKPLIDPKPVKEKSATLARKPGKFQRREI